MEENKKRLVKLYESLGIPINEMNIHSGQLPNELTIADKDKVSYGNISCQYEREFEILQSIKSAEFRETIVAGLEIDPLQINQPGWTPEIEKMMLARKLKNE